MFGWERGEKTGDRGIARGFPYGFSRRGIGQPGSEALRREKEWRACVNADLHHASVGVTQQAIFSMETQRSSNNAVRFAVSNTTNAVRRTIATSTMRTMSATVTAIARVNARRVLALWTLFY